MLFGVSLSGIESASVSTESDEQLIAVTVTFRCETNVLNDANTRTDTVVVKFPMVRRCFSFDFCPPENECLSFHHAWIRIKVPRRIESADRTRFAWASVYADEQPIVSTTH